MDKNSVVVVCDPFYLSVNTSQINSLRSPSPNRSLKGFKLFKVISQKLGKGIRKSKEEKCTSSDDDEDSNSSTNSISQKDQKQTQRNELKCNCDYFYKNQPVLKQPGKPEMTEGKKCLKFSTPCRYHHSSGSDTYSSNDDSSESNDIDQKRSHVSLNDSSASSSSSGSYKQSTKVVCKGLKNLNLNSKSLSCFSISQVKDSSERRDSNSKEKRTKKSPQKILRQPPIHTYVRGISGLPTIKVLSSRTSYSNQYSRG